MGRGKKATLAQIKKLREVQEGRGGRVKKGRATRGTNCGLRLNLRKGCVWMVNFVLGGELCLL